MCHLLLAHVPVLGELGLAEEARGPQLPEVAPPGARALEPDDISRAVEEVVHHAEGRAVGEGGVVLLEEFARHAGRAHDDGVFRAEGEAEQRCAVGSGHLRELLVGVGPGEEWQATEEWPSGGAGGPGQRLGFGLGFGFGKWLLLPRNI